jgi:hypothetical protein
VLVVTSIASVGALTEPLLLQCGALLLCHGDKCSFTSEFRTKELRAAAHAAIVRLRNPRCSTSTAMAAAIAFIAVSKSTTA